jgi:hypothetical protein
MDAMCLLFARLRIGKEESTQNRLGIEQSRAKYEPECSFFPACQGARVELVRRTDAVHSA